MIHKPGVSQPSGYPSGSKPEWQDLGLRAGTKCQPEAAVYSDYPHRPNFFLYPSFLFILFFNLNGYSNPIKCKGSSSALPPI